MNEAICCDAATWFWYDFHSDYFPFNPILTSASHVAVLEKTHEKLVAIGFSSDALEIEIY